MAAKGQCRFAEHVYFASLIGGGEVVIEPCGEPAAHTVICRFDTDGGMVIQLEPEVCDEHERKLADARGYARSIKIRQPIT